VPVATPPRPAPGGMGKPKWPRVPLGRTPSPGLPPRPKTIDPRISLKISVRHFPIHPHRYAALTFTHAFS
jgi:hypothetical protein